MRDPALRAATGRWINAMARWTHFVTLTFKEPVTQAKAIRLGRDWLRGVARDLAASHVPFAWTLETTSAEARWHIHVMLAVPLNARPCDAVALDVLWRGVAGSVAGFTRTEQFDPRRGGATYLSKTERWDVNTACPRTRRCRKTRCVEAPTGWD